VETAESSFVAEIPDELLERRVVRESDAPALEAGDRGSFLSRIREGL
jgi:hypothetical protein